MTTRKLVNFTAIITLAALIGSCSLWRKETKVTMADLRLQSGLLCKYNGRFDSYTN